MNLLSIAAALGVVQAIFERGWLGGLLGIQPGPIEAFIPLMVFAIVFGLSMDYEVFLVSRIHEEWRTARRRERGRARGTRPHRPRHHRSRRGHGRRLRILRRRRRPRPQTLRARTGNRRLPRRDRHPQILLPAVLELLGRRTWAFPNWFDRRLPQLAIEPTPAAEPIPALEEAA